MYCGKNRRLGMCVAVVKHALQDMFHFFFSGPMNTVQQFQQYRITLHISDCI
ncbi:hypothetical protein D3C78_598960 [compost metagenome]